MKSQTLSSYRKLLLALIVVFASYPVLMLDGFFGQCLEMVLSLTVLTRGVILRYGRKKQSYLAFSVSILLAVLWLSSILLPGHPWLQQLRIIFVIVFLGCIVFWLSWDVFKSTKVSMDNRLYGAICIYLLMGFFFANIYLALNLFMPNSVVCNAPLCQDNFEAKFQNGLHIYYSFTTLTTVGYGDLVPNSAVAGMFSNMEALTGQLYLAIVVARLVGIQLMKATSTHD